MAQLVFKIPYYVSNGGDGSVTVRFTTTLKQAEKADEELEEGWGESSVDSLHIRVDDEKVYIRLYEEVDGKYQFVWRQVVQDS